MPLELRVDAAAFAGDPARGALPSFQTVPPRRLLFEQIHPRANDIDLAIDAEADFQPLDAPVIVFLDHQGLAHIKQVYRKVYLHVLQVKEGDSGNAAYWYRRPRQPVVTDSLDAEGERIASILLR